MKEYIEQAVAIERARNELDLINKSHWSADEIVDFLKRLPAADVVEVQHGRWMRTDAFPHHVYCSVCSATYVPNDRWQIWEDRPGEGGLPRNYCPNCGAKMDGGADDGRD